ncbi:MAG TPA: DUF433 domain-containing protein [Herpetosiphonaceae bacterium]|uniref:DUF433 domain-containing protein n=1 Tax=uncultured Chloroflexia bacterium TaxID=1672391 RepID=A0A6J4K515_9CHLR|nr:MAG: hypothetical protein AVDCRST_MAG26-4433 [uncultured Chloroflexia bacterium]HSH77141.1 DUF433 domain-containing protein [Herpetosiphonaceae bacterium]
MAQLTNLSALREQGALDELIRRVHHDKQDFVIEDLTMPVAAVIDINKFQLLTDLLAKADGAIVVEGAEPMVRGSNVKIREIAERHLLGDSMDDLHRLFPQLRLSQIHAALAYYYDHSDTVDDLIRARREERSAAHPAASLVAHEERERDEAQAREEGRG